MTLDRKALIEKHGTIAGAAKALGIPRQTLSSRLRNGASGIDKPSGGGKSLADFRAVHDRAFMVPKKIQDGLKRLNGGWEYEQAFARLCEVSLTDLGDYRDQFATHIVVVRRDGKRAWAATPALAEKMRGMIR